MNIKSFIWKWLYYFKARNDYNAIAKAREERFSDNPGNFVQHCDYHGYYDIREGCRYCNSKGGK